MQGIERLVRDVYADRATSVVFTVPMTCRIRCAWSDARTDPALHDAAVWTPYALLDVRARTDELEHLLLTEALQSLRVATSGAIAARVSPDDGAPPARGVVWCCSSAADGRERPFHRHGVRALPMDGWRLSPDRYGAQAPADVMMRLVCALIDVLLASHPAEMRDALLRSCVAGAVVSGRRWRDDFHDDGALYRGGYDGAVVQPRYAPGRRISIAEL